MCDFKILLIDDDRLSLNSMAKALKLNGYEVDMFTNPELACEVFQKKYYSMVMSDVMMQPFDGFTVLKKIKNIDQEVPVILFSGFFTDEKIQMAKALGAYETYAKPVPISDIINIFNKFKTEK